MLKDLQKIQSTQSKTEPRKVTQTLINPELEQDLQQLYEVRNRSDFLQQEFLLRQLAQKYNFELEEFRPLFQNYSQKKLIEASQGWQKQSLQIKYSVNYVCHQAVNSNLFSLFAAMAGVGFTLFQFGTQMHGFVTELQEQNTIARRQAIYEAWNIIRENQAQIVIPQEDYRPNGGVTQALEDLYSYDVNLSGLYIKKTQLVKLNLEKNKNLKNADLSYSNFQASNLSYAKLNYVNLNESDLSHVRFFQTELNHALFKKTHLNHAELTSAELNHAQLIKAEMIGADLSCAELKSANLTQANLEETILSRTDFEGADLQDVTWNNADLNKANLINAKNLNPEQLRKAKNWRTATYNPEFIPQLCWIHGGNLSTMNLSQFNCNQLYFKQLNGVNFHQADLQGVNLSEGILTQANLSQANLQNATLHRVDFQGADFQGANLEKANLLCANFSDATHLEPQQVKQAANWRHAIYSKEFSHKLGLNTKPSFRSCL
jgi:uncharacterized protein YjbI with pentapeptide repeats